MVTQPNIAQGIRFKDTVFHQGPEDFGFLSSGPWFQLYLSE